MASLLTHAVVGVALGQAAKLDWRKGWRFWCAAISCSILPDIDVIGFQLGIPYGDLWGHRGLTHSILFAAIVGFLLTVLLVNCWRERWKLALLLFGIAASHGLLDAMTNGGLGVAFFSPFNPQRYFFPWRPIRVSPLSAQAFFSGRGIGILWSEIRWVWGPAVLVGLALYSLHLWREDQRTQEKL